MRTQAARTLGDARATQAFDGLVKLLRDPGLRVQMFAAQSLGKLARTDAVAPIFSMLAADATRDAYLRHAGVMALARLGLPGSFLDWYWLPLFPMFVVFFISAMAETNRPPFDLPEAESELVAGYMVEYSSTPYLLFMLGEYVAIVTMCALGTILFLGGWLSPIPFAPFTWVPGLIWFALKASFLFFMIAMVKAMVPRYRYDQLMRLGWKVFLPLSLFWVVLVSGWLQITRYGVLG